jgi:hypothetical protein
MVSKIVPVRIPPEGGTRNLFQQPARANPIVFVDGTSREQIVDRHCPPGHSRFCLCDFATRVNCRSFGICEAIDFDHIVTDQIYVPHNKSTGGKVVAAFLG